MVHTYPYMHTYAHAQTHVPCLSHIHTCICTHMPVLICTYTHTCTYTHICTCTQTHTCVRAEATRMSVYTHIHTFSLSLTHTHKEHRHTHKPVHKPTHALLLKWQGWAFYTQTHVQTHTNKHTNSHACLCWSDEGECLQQRALKTWQSGCGPERMPTSAFAQYVCDKGKCHLSIVNSRWVSLIEGPEEVAKRMCVFLLSMCVTRMNVIWENSQTFTQKADVVYIYTYITPTPTPT